MKKLSFYLIFFLHFFCIEANAQKRYFEWMNAKSGTRERILVDNRAYLREIAPNQWKQIAVIDVDADDLSDLADTFHNFYFPDSIGDNVLFTVSGTGKVYRFNINKLKLTRLDKTYFKGYNFYAPQFIRKDTLYSFGGTGFWGYSKALTFYDKKLREWQEFRAINFGPESFVEGYQGYSKQSDKFYSGAPTQLLHLKNYKRVINDTLFAFDFKKLEWSRLGRIMSNIPFKEENTTRVLWDGTHFLRITLNKVYLLDPIKNEAFLVDNEKFFFDTNNTFQILGDTIYNYQSNFITITKVSKSQLLKEAKFIGEFYDDFEDDNLYQYAYLTLFFGAFSLISYIVYRKKRNHSNSKLAKNTNFDSLELELLKKLIGSELNEEKYISVLEINEILQLNAKSPEYQRRIRSKFLKDLNLKFLINFKVNDAVIRVKSHEDSRLVLYKLINEAKIHSTKFLN
jgi:hypothetical protein